MAWAFRILVSLDALLLAVLFFYKASGEDPAGEGMRLGAATIMLILFAAILFLYWLVKWQPVRIVLLALLSLPLLVTIYGIVRMLG
jgi:hypothetical protein